jgi:hypothetical protein
MGERAFSRFGVMNSSRKIYLTKRARNIQWDFCSKEGGSIWVASKRMDDERNKKLTENGNRVYDFS